jgi:hypothetical protein
MPDVAQMARQMATGDENYINPHVFAGPCESRLQILRRRRDTPETIMINRESEISRLAPPLKTQPLGGDPLCRPAPSFGVGTVHSACFNVIARL